MAVVQYASLFVSATINTTPTQQQQQSTTQGFLKGKEIHYCTDLLVIFYLCIPKHRRFSTVVFATE
eukprot:GDKH01008345.1.p1 GENE.GDKH01008345.1~~GDKH01008345.1.p1  ORF type:complete len:66 (-),score=0.06 GDKH01008345.1:77-274(-)